MSELKKCPLCGAELKVYGPEDWKPTFYDPDSGGDPYTAVCDCGFNFHTNHYDYAEFVKAVNRRAQPERSKGCEYCGDHEDLAFGHDSLKRVGSIYIDKNLLVADLYSESMAVVICFCPVCGKRLEVEQDG